MLVSQTMDRDAAAGKRALVPRKTSAGASRQHEGRPDIRTHRTRLNRAYRLTAAIVALVATIAVVSGCGALDGETGLLEGTVTVGPITAAEQPGASPNVRPYAATIDIKTLDGGHVTSVTSDDAGRFSIRLRAGDYRLIPVTPEGAPLPFAAPLDVTVIAGETTAALIEYDSGIRGPD